MFELLSFSLFLQKDFDVREMREFNKTVTKLVGEAAAHYPEMEEAVSMYFTQVQFLTYTLPA